MIREGGGLKALLERFEGQKKLNPRDDSLLAALKAILVLARNEKKLCYDKRFQLNEINYTIN